jgi:hypothetical protein
MYSVASKPSKATWLDWPTSGCLHLGHEPTINFVPSGSPDSTSEPYPVALPISIAATFALQKGQSIMNVGVDLSMHPPLKLYPLVDFLIHKPLG